jgi:hypothetical protein
VGLCTREMEPAVGRLALTDKGILIRLVRPVNAEFKGAGRKAVR